MSFDRTTRALGVATSQQAGTVDRHAAVLTVCQHAKDIEDAAMLLNMLGLDKELPVRGLGAGASWQ